MKCEIRDLTLSQLMHTMLFYNGKPENSEQNQNFAKFDARFYGAAHIIFTKFVEMMHAKIER